MTLDRLWVHFTFWIYSPRGQRGQRGQHAKAPSCDEARLYCNNHFQEQRALTGIVHGSGCCLGGQSPRRICIPQGHACRLPLGVAFVLNLVPPPASRILVRRCLDRTNSVIIHPISRTIGSTFRRPLLHPTKASGVSATCLPTGSRCLSRKAP